MSLEFTRSFPAPTRRLGFREFKASDLPHIRRMLADDEAARIFAQLVSRPDYAERWLTKNLTRYEQHGFGLWAVERRSDGQFIGDCGLTIQHLGNRELLELGYHLTLEARGQGYATEAARACLAYAFTKLRAEKLFSIVRVDNPASAKVAARIHRRREPGHQKAGREVTLFVTDRADWAQDSAATGAE